MEPIRAQLQGMVKITGRIVSFVPAYNYHTKQTKIYAIFVADDGEIFETTLEGLTEIKASPKP